MQLTQNQREFVNERERNCCVLSIPGSGKTFVITTKLAEILRRGGSATAVTFTAEAGRELRSRIAAKGLPADQLTRLETGTFHSITMARLRVLQPDVMRRKIAKAGQCRTMMARAIEVGMGGGMPEWVINCVEAWRAMPEPLDQNFSILGDLGFHGQDATEAVGRTMNAYMRMMDESHIIDFTEIMWRGRELLKGWRGAAVYSPWEEAPEREVGKTIFSGSHVLVDEMQDIDAMQLEYMLLHHLEHGLAVDGVGDDDQSIYAFRAGLGYSGMQKFVLETGARKIFLDTNFRCKEEILAWAGKVIEQNVNREKKELQADRGRGGSVRFLAVTKPANGDELTRVALMVQDDQRASSKGESAILARSNGTLRKMEKVLQQRNIDYVMIGGKSMWDEDPACLWAHALVELGRMTLGPGLRSLLYWCGANESDLTKIAVGLKRSHLWKLDLKKLDLSAVGMSSTARIAEEWEALAKTDWSDKQKSAEALIKSAMTVAAMASSSRVNRNKEQVVVSLMESAGSILGGMEGDLRTRAKWAVGLDRKKREEHARVKLVTMHSSKGLEFENVYIVDATEKTIPGKAEGAEVEEERRVLYVAMTRAKDSLTISYTVGQYKPCPFLMGVNPLVRPIDADEVLGYSVERVRHSNEARTG